MSRILHHEDFAPYIDKAFRFSGWPGVLRLTEIAPSRHASEVDVTRIPFTLIFAGPRGDVLSEGLWTATAEDGSSFDLYVMPIHTPARDRQEYQAVFN